MHHLNLSYERVLPFTEIASLNVKLHMYFQCDELKIWHYSSSVCQWWWFMFMNVGLNTTWNFDMCDSLQFIAVFIQPVSVYKGI
jgi:hypothetical protein